MPLRTPLEAALNPSRTDWIELMLSSTGRLSRTTFLLAAAGLLALGGAYEAWGAGLRLGWLVYPALLFPTACILSKRLHDFGRAGWWAFLIVWALVEAWPLRTDPLGDAFTVGLILGLSVLGLMPGERGPNRFGPKPDDQRNAPRMT